MADADDLDALLESVQLLDEVVQRREDVPALHPKPEIDRALRALLRAVVGDGDMGDPLPTSDDRSIEVALSLSDIRSLVEDLTGIPLEQLLDHFVAEGDHDGSPSDDNEA